MARTKHALTHNKKDKQAVIEAAQNYPTSFNIHHAADESLWGDIDVVLAAVAANGYNFQLVPDALKDDREVVSVALTSNGCNLRFCSEEFQSDKSFVLVAVKSKGEALRWCSRDLADDKEIVRLAVDQYGGALAYASDRLKNDKEIVLTALGVGSTSQTTRLRYEVFSYASAELRRDREVVIAAIQRCGGRVIMYVSSQELWNDREIIMMAAKDDWRSLNHASPALLSDREIIMKAIEQDGAALMHASEELQGDREIVMTALRSCDQFGKALRYASEDLKNDKEIVLQAVRVTGFSLQYASPTWRGNREVVEVALKNRHYIETSAIIEHVSQELRADRQFIRAAVEDDSYTLYLASKELQMDPDMVALAWETMNERHDYELFRMFHNSSLRCHYIEEMTAVFKGLKARDKTHYFEVADPQTTVQNAERWLSESMEKKWLMREIMPFFGIPPEIGRSVATFAGTEEDQQISSRLLRFGSVLCHTKKGMEVKGRVDIWDDFVADAKTAIDNDSW
uniref:DUF4116 domain-containing protein n=1 Tax=Helicotheca tamesis TaxID=374047 RepID=A0A7S2GW86_9STRA|mmetsp:Transcript_12762/g.17580  ORF Transcript_12762/g.17580 Transcript_12762/m.17580 type:complete len:512 (+) Transcript_12762:24-1559(+)|eukprot:CAMPEP_0185726064 /NCGR_PEP_ID=MMETSP1171-20130828/2153_1 /TAXON_ID=374046 /ORGANISM="Helicotheca tamensis, Strain CCMP826" /LENGTH=511 /DNA_ID=CAMNT_0028394341 /DNA_START=1 /DNA_END=1536 /DNA_ORIENTATION=-